MSDEGRVTSDEGKSWGPAPAGYRWKVGEPPAAGWWWLRAPNLTARIVKAWPSSWGAIVHDMSHDWRLLHGRPYEHAGPIPMPEGEEA